MAAMAQAGAMAGAVGIRANGPADVAAIRAVVDLPIVGIDKRPDIDPLVYITPSLESVAVLVEAGADLVAIDATLRPRNGGGAPSAAHLLTQIRDAFPGLPVMADVSNVAEGLAAAEAGADIVATTLSGYTDGAVASDGPDIALIAALVSLQDRPVVAEGRFSTPAQVVAALDAGAHAVVVGTAITDALALARKFVGAAHMRASAREPSHSA
jgi:N-acylglucosamine-6-phosphate 2-epimerase